MKQNIIMVRGRTQTFRINLTDADGAAYTLEDGEEIIFGVKKNYFDNDFLIKKTLTATNLVDGAYELKLCPPDTECMACGDGYCYDVGMQSGDDYYTLIPCSKFVLEHNVTCCEEGE